MAKRKRPVSGSSTPYRQVTNIFSGMSGHRCSLTRSSTSPGSTIRWAEARSTLRVAAITSAAGHALVGHVADHEADLAVGQRDHVVEVAADLARRPVVGGHLPAGQLRELLGQEVLLDQLGDLELLLEALAGGGLGLLLAHELADPQRRRGLRGEVVEQLAVVGGVLLLGQPRAEVEHADQLALADQRDGELDAGRLQLGQRRRVELQRLDVDRPAGALQVGEQRVVGCDVDRRRIAAGRARRDALRARRALLLAGRRRMRVRNVRVRAAIAGSFLCGVRPGIVTGLEDVLQVAERRDEVARADAREHRLGDLEEAVRVALERHREARAAVDGLELVAPAARRPGRR